MKQAITMPRMMNREGIIARFAKVLADLPMEQGWRIEVHEQKPKRSDPQNKYLWALYDFILKRGGEAMGGWTRDDLHEFFLGNHFGWERKVLFGNPRRVPARRSSKLSKVEFVDFVESILRFMADQGVYLPSPEDDWEQVLRQ